jgi:VanZ family protein
MITNRRRRWLTAYAPLLVWIGVIFLLSSGQGSMSRTSLIIRPILEFLFPSASEQTLLLYHGYVRKFAHFFEYAVLGFLACRAFTGSLQNLVRKHGYVFAIGLLIVVAVLDEINQSFNPARTGSPFDVLIDLSGGFSAIGLFYLFARRRNSLATD